MNKVQRKREKCWIVLKWGESIFWNIARRKVLINEEAKKMEYMKGIKKTRENGIGRRQGKKKRFIYKIYCPFFSLEFQFLLQSLAIIFFLCFLSLILILSSLFSSMFVVCFSCVLWFRFLRSSFPRSFIYFTIFLSIFAFFSCHYHVLPSLSVICFILFSEYFSFSQSMYFFLLPSFSLVSLPLSTFYLSYFFHLHMQLFRRHFFLSLASYLFI